MIAELFVLVTMMTVGAMVTMAIGVRPYWALVAVSLPVGAAVLAVVALVIAALRLPLYPLWVLGGSILIAILLGTSQVRRRQRGYWMAVGAAIAVACLAVVILYDVALVNLTADSYRYMSIGSVIARQGSLDAVSALGLQQRALVVPIIHSLADLGGNFYLHSFGPLMALSGLSVLVWLGIKALGSLSSRLRGSVVLACGVALLVTNSRFVFNAFYVNGHMIFAVWLLILVGCIWLVITEQASDRLTWVAMVIGPALALVRPESSLVVVLALVPLLPSQRISKQWKARLLWSIGTAMVLWHTVILLAYQKEEEVPLEITAMVSLGLLVVMAGIVIRFGRMNLSDRLPCLVAAALFLLLALFAVVEREIFVNSWNATIENVIRGGGFYGLSLVTLGVLIGMSYLTRRVEQMSVLVFTVVTALPFGFLMAHLRGGAYRVGPGDSLNRMLLHWLPLAVLSLIAMMQSRSAFSPARDAVADRAVSQVRAGLAQRADRG